MKSNAKPNDTKKKILVIVLLVGLLGVVGWQNFSSKSSEDDSAAEQSTLVAVKPTGPLTGSAALTALNQRLPKVDLEQVLAHDPFQLLTISETVAGMESQTYGDDPSGSAVPEDSSSDSSQPPTLQVSAILHGGPRPAVMIGQQLYYEKDPLAGGWRILTIHADRVTVERIDDAP